MDWRYVLGASTMEPREIAESPSTMPFNTHSVLAHLRWRLRIRHLVEQRTPGFHSWQDNHWLMYCDRPCIYLGEADAADLRGRWSAAVSDIFASAAPAERNGCAALITRGKSPCAYVFQCRICARLRGFWDSH